MLEALVNVGPNYKGPKVNFTALVKFGYMLEIHFDGQSAGKTL